MTADEAKALSHIRRHGDDRMLRAKRWEPVKLSLYRKGHLRRRVGDWAWIAVERDLTR